MPTLNEIELGLKLYKLLLVGQPGVGKTVAAASFHDAEPYMENQEKLLFSYDFDFRMKPIKKFFPDAPIEFQSFASGEFQEYRDHFLDLAEAMRRDDFESFHRKHEWPTRPPVTLVKDSLTFLADGVMQYLLSYRSRRSKDPDIETVRGQDSIRRIGSIDIPSMPEWMGESMGLTQIIDAAKMLPCNFILTAHYTKSLDVGGSGGKIASVKYKNVITVGNKISEKIPGFFDEVYTMYTQQGVNQDDPLKRVIRTVPYIDELGKTCLPLPAEFEVPSNGDLFGTLKTLLNG